MGEPVGITAATWPVARFTRAKIDAGLAWIDVVGVLKEIEQAYGWPKEP